MAEKMLEVKAAELLPGDIVAADVYNQSGKILATINTKLTENIILGLKKNYITSVYIYRQVDSAKEPIKVNCKEILHNEAEEIIDHSILKFIKRGKSITELKKIILDILSIDQVCDLMFKLRGFGENLFRHSIGVAIYSVAVGRELYFPPHRLTILGTAALLHDIGMTKVPKAILNNSGSLTEEEKEYIKQHPRYGFEMIQSDGYFKAEIATIILQHQERYDGTGYPNGLHNEKIHTMAQIIAVCDVYDALASDRPHRQKYKRSESVEYLLGTGNFYFNHEIVKALINTIIIYPYGQWIELNTKETGIVIEEIKEVIQQFNIRPKVMIYFDKDGNALPEPKLIDLSYKENMNLSIDRVI